MYNKLMFSGKIYKIKKGKEAQWRLWCKKINEIYRLEAIKTLQQEKNVLEAFYIFSINDEYYTLGVGMGKCLTPDANNELNRKHKQQKLECLGEEVQLEELYKIDLTSEENSF